MMPETDMMTRGWCPGVLKPMPSGDGLLARVHPGNGVLSHEQAHGLVQAAEAGGNGVINITGRANLQIRGVREETRTELERRLDALGLLEPSPRGPFRPTVVSPLAGIDPAEMVDAVALAATVEEIAQGLQLPPKFLVAIESGGSYPLDEVAADIRVRAVARDTVAIGLAGPGGVLWGASCPAAEADAILRRLLPDLADALDRQCARRGRQLSPATRAALLGLPAGPGDPPETPLVPDPEHTTRAGLFTLGGGRVAVLASPPFGQMSAGMLAGAASLAAALGAGGIRLSPCRGIVFPDVPADDVQPMLDALARLGFVTDPDDTRLRLVTCPGAPACLHARCRTHELADRLYRRFRGRGCRETVHLSGCAKGCAHPGSARVTIVAREGGEFDVVLDGGPQDQPFSRLDVEGLCRLVSTGQRLDLVAGGSDT